MNHLPTVTVLLAVILSLLKLTGLIDWSWAWVLAPFWLLVLGIVLTLAVICAFGYVLRRYS